MTTKSSSAASGEWENPYMPTPMCGVAGIGATMITGRTYHPDHDLSTHLRKSHDYMKAKGNA